MSENNTSASAAQPTTSLESRPTNKLRSCVICRRRKVRCDKLSPCTNCRRANITCVVPSSDRPPRWARRLERLASISDEASTGGNPSQDGGQGVSQVRERLRNLETLVKDLNEQLEKAREGIASDNGKTSASSSEMAEPSTSKPSPASGTHPPKPFGRMVSQDAASTRYVSSGFWSRVSDEIDGLKIDAVQLSGSDSEESSYENSQGKTPSTLESSRTPSDRHGFIFGRGAASPGRDMGDFRPSPSQVPFLLDIFSENVNILLGVVHMPSIRLMARRIRATGGASAVDECLMFAIYYAAVTSMEGEDVLTNFGTTKADLNLKYRVGLESALSRADFMNNPELKLVQALLIFLFLARRHDRPRFVWMMTGMAIRMAQSIGLQRDGSNFPQMKPFEVEIRRRVWWMLCALDLRTSEDQGMDLSIAYDSFDTKPPTNVNDADLDPDMLEVPTERYELTDISASLMMIDQCILTRQMMSPEVKSSDSALQKQSQLLDTMREALEKRLLQYNPQPDSTFTWVGITSVRVLISKMLLFIYLPGLFSSPNEQFSEDIRRKMLVAAIEVAEYNHALSSREDARPWHWICQTYTHWNAVVYMLLEVCRRPWSPICERTWIALHSKWLIPEDTKTDTSSRIWVPLRKLMVKARRHRATELERLRGDMVAISQLEAADSSIPAPSSSGVLFPPENSAERFRKHWRNLLAPNKGTDDYHRTAEIPEVGQAKPLSAGDLHAHPVGNLTGSGFSSGRFRQPEPAHPGLHYSGYSHDSSTPDVAMVPPPIISSIEQMGGTGHDSNLLETGEWTGGQGNDQKFTPWLWSTEGVDFTSLNDGDMAMDVDWNDWLRTAAVMNQDANVPPGY